ncbi:MAG: N-acetylmuramoyl-L-alanine amidase [Gammaproteobacteria bacterium]|nr:N-acetylmuramoyl-L-alanine amidase [Gammaproteobacteria bacterium]
MDVVVIDPGHGGRQTVGGSSPNNAVGPAGTLEKDLTLDIALRAAPLLVDHGLRCVLTRDTDENLGLSARARVAREQRATAFVSIHFNGFNRRAQGTETFVHAGSTPPSTTLARLVQQFMLDATLLADRGVKRARFGVLAPASHHPSTAACLVEVSFMDVPEEEQRLANPSYRQGIAEALAAAVSEFVRGASFQLPAEVAMEAPEPEDGYELIVR